MDQTFFFIVNPYSKSGKTKNIWSKKILPELDKQNIRYAWSYTHKIGEASFLSAFAQDSGYSVVVAVGGDGTINEIVNGLMGKILFNSTSLQEPEICGGNTLLQKVNKHSNTISTLAIIPAGTGCDFARTIGIPNNFKAALEIAIRGKKLLCDIGLVTCIDTTEFEQEKKISRYFINIAGCGISAETMKKIKIYKKYFGSKLSYLLGGLSTVLKNYSYPVRINYDNKPQINTNIFSVFVCNAKYCGAGMLVGSEAKINDNFLFINQINKINKWKTLLLSPRLYSGKFKDLSHFISLKKVSTLEIFPQNENPASIECDGEYTGILPAHFSISPTKLEIKVPNSFF